MPTYEYRREDGTTFEIKQSINDDALERCPETGQKVERIISGGGGVVYKGSGWYVTDYKDGDRKEKRAEAAEKRNGESGNEGSSETSSDGSENSDSSSNTDTSSNE